MNKSESTSIQKQIKEHYKSTFPAGGKLILGVSGGPDSMALLYLLHKNEIPVFVVHINYGLRGDDSEDDQRLVEDICAMWGIECCSVSLDKKEQSGNFQDWARNQRYKIFRDLKSELDAAGIAVAHHADDQYETILFKMLRGGGASSWKGLQLWDGEIFRPLLNYSKAEIIDFCESEIVPYRKDASNESNDYARNALRNSVFPVFDEFIPGWQSNVDSISKKAAITDEALTSLLQGIVKSNSLMIKAMTEYSPVLKMALIKRFVLEYADFRISKGQLTEAHELLENQTGKEIELSDTVSLVKDRGLLSIKRKSDSLVETTISMDEAKIGIKIADWELRLSSELPSQGLVISVDEIEWPINLRRWQKGDRFQPFGMLGTQKISDHLTNRKINASQREESLILIDAGGTICAILYPQTAINGENGCISELLKITQATKKVLSISKS